MRARSATALIVAAAFGLGAIGAQEADVENADVEQDLADPDFVERRNELVREADDALRQLRSENEDAAELMDRAYGHAVFNTTKGGLLLTGAGGTGIARPHDRDEITFMRLGSAGIGLGAGFESYRLVLLLMDEETYANFVSGGWDGALAAQATAGSQGVAADEQMLGGVRAFRITDGGLMAQVDVTGVRFWPARNLNRAAETEARVAAAARRGEPVGPNEAREVQVATAEEAAERDADDEREGPREEDASSDADEEQ